MCYRVSHNRHTLLVWLGEAMLLGVNAFDSHALDAALCVRTQVKDAAAQVVHMRRAEQPNGRVADSVLTSDRIESQSAHGPSQVHAK